MALTACCITAATLIGNASWAVEGPPARSHAVLVGVSTYPALGDRFDLAGPPNDIAMLTRLLVDRFGFHLGDIVELSEAAGRDHSELLPTRDNVLRELGAVAERATRGDRVFVLLAGHGSQQPGGQATDESGGLDEIFLPRDVGRWQAQPGSAGVANAIVDDEFRAWIQRLRGTGAMCWIIFDCCHSGDLARAVNSWPQSDVERSVPPHELAVPELPSSQTPPGSSGERPTDLKNIAILYACQPGEKTVDRRVLEGSTSVACGLLTSTVTQVLETASRPMSYATLTAEVLRLYRAEGRTRGPTPYCEGDFSKTILSSDRHHVQGHTLTRDLLSGKLTLDAGVLHAITPGTVLVVRRPTALTESNCSDDTVGHVRVIDVALRTSRVEPVAYDSAPAPESGAIDGMLASIVFRAIGDQRLRVANQIVGSDGTEPATVGNRLQSLDRLRPIVTFVGPDTDHEWTIHGDATGATVASRNEESSSEFHVPNDKGVDAFTDALADLLTRIARADSLVRAASHCQPCSEQGLVIKFGTQAERPMPESAVRLKLGDRFTLSITNTSARALDVTVLHIGPDKVISPLYPQPLRGETSRFECGDSRSLGLTCDAGGKGREWLVVLAVVATRAPMDFTALASPLAEGERSVGNGPLGSLLASHDALTRGMHADDANACGADLIALDVTR